MIIIVLAVTICILAGLWTYARWNFGTLEKLGIPVVEHHPLLGSTKEIYESVGGLNDLEWVKKYGPIFGVYEGRQPQIFVAVPELIRLICVKDSDYFNSKRDLEFNDPVLNEMPDFQNYEKWKTMRGLATPAFTSAKVKMMNLPMREATQEFVQSLKGKIRQSENGVCEKFAIDEAIHTMLTDLISRVVFSVKISGNTDSNNEFAKIVQEMVTPPQDDSNKSLLYWSHTFPILKKFVTPIFKPEPVQRFRHLFKQLMNERRRSGVKHNDVLDMVIEWFDLLESDPEMKKVGINELTLICSALVFFFAAQDQLSTLTSCVIYHMTKDSELERRIYAELDEVFAKHGGKLEHEQFQELTLLNSCLNESLRLYPFFHRAERVCTKDWRNEEYNLSVKKGTAIQIPIWAINREYNENGEEFDPERFMPGNKEKLNVYSSTSFGFGPRNCTGKRFAIEAMPLILAYILKDFKFKARKETELKFLPGGPFFAPHEKIIVDVMERK